MKKENYTILRFFASHLIFWDRGLATYQQVFLNFIMSAIFLHQNKGTKNVRRSSNSEQFVSTHTHRKNILASNISSSFYEIRDASSFLMASVKTWLGWSWGAWRKSSGITLHWSQFKNKKGRIYIESEERSLGHCKNICFLTSWKSYTKDVKLQDRIRFV